MIYVKKSNRQKNSINSINRKSISSINIKYKITIIIFFN